MQIVQTKKSNTHTNKDKMSYWRKKRDRGRGKSQQKKELLLTHKTHSLSLEWKDNKTEESRRKTETMVMSNVFKCK